jgi:PPP family 3-phenylpropionic acid transporter
VLSPLARFALLYAMLYAAFGVISPFMPAFLADKGLSSQQIAIAVGAGTAIRLVSGPLVGRLADLTGAWRALLCICAGAASAAAVGYVWTSRFAAMFAVTLVQSIVLAPLAPVADAMALSASRSPPAFEYGWVRGVGSAAFVAALIAAGVAANRWGLVISIEFNAVLLGGAAFCSMLIPDIATEGGSGLAAIGGIRLLLSLSAFRRLLVVGALILGSHALHDTFAVIRWHAAGISTATASVLWSESVFAEVFVFLLVGPLILHRLGPGRAAMLAATAAVVRWIALGATNNVVVVAMVEPLHGLTFALFHLSAMQVIGECVPNRLVATAQAVYGTLAVGASTALLTLASGSLYAVLGGYAFWVMSCLCLAAIPLAAGMIRQRASGQTT